jgi:hypothetical protein
VRSRRFAERETNFPLSEACGRSQIARHRGGLRAQVDQSWLPVEEMSKWAFAPYGPIVLEERSVAASGLIAVSDHCRRITAPRKVHDAIKRGFGAWQGRIARGK